MKNDITSPATSTDTYKIEVDTTDGKYKIVKVENGVKFPVGEFYKLCDREARDVRELMDN